MKKLYNLIFLVIVVSLNLSAQSMGIVSVTPKYKQVWLKVYQGEESLLIRKNAKQQKKFKEPKTILEHLLWKYTPQTICDVSQGTCDEKFLSYPLDKWFAFLGKYTDWQEAKDIWIKLDHCFQVETMEGEIEGVLKYRLYDGDKLLRIDGISMVYKNDKWVMINGWFNGKKTKFNIGVTICKQTY